MQPPVLALLSLALVCAAVSSSSVCSSVDFECVSVGEESRCVYGGNSTPSAVCGCSDGSCHFLNSTVFVCHNVSNCGHVHDEAHGDHEEHEEHDDHHGIQEPDMAVLFVAFCLLLAAVWVSLCSISYIPSFLNIPFSVLLFLSGFALGAGVDSFGDLGLSVSYIGNLHPHVILFVFLPPLLYESSSAINFHVFKRIFSSSLWLAGPGVLVASGLTGLLIQATFTVYGEFGWSWAESMLLGSMLSATDPVAVVAALSALGAKPQLSVLIEGESLLNDGTAFVFFLVLLDIVKGASPSGGEIVGTLVQLALGGPLWGCAVFLVVYLWLMKMHNRGYPMMEITVVVASVYMTFIIGEVYLHVSGVLATVTFGLLMSFRGQYIMSVTSHHANHAVWENIAWIANAAIFVIAGILVYGNFSNGVLNERKGLSVLYLFVLYIYLHAVRALVVAASYPLLRLLGYGLSMKEAMMLWFGGLRGAVGLALGILVDTETDIPEIIRSHINFHVSGIVFLTLLVNGMLTEPVYHWLKINPLPKERISLLSEAFDELSHSRNERIRELNGNWLYKDANWPRVRRIVPDFTVADLSSGRIMYEPPSVPTALSEPNFWEVWLDAMGNKPIEEQKEVCRKLFARFDEDNDGVLNKEEMVTFLRSKELNLKFKKKQAEFFMQQLDVGQDGNINLMEFVDGVTAFYDILSTRSLREEHHAESLRGPRIFKVHHYTSGDQTSQQMIRQVHYEAYFNALKNHYSELQEEAVLGGAAYVLLMEAVDAGIDLNEDISTGRVTVNDKLASLSMETDEEMADLAECNPIIREWTTFTKLINFNKFVMFFKDVPLIKFGVNWYVFFKLRVLVEAITAYVRAHEEVRKLDTMRFAVDEHGHQLVLLIDRHVCEAQEKLCALSREYEALFPLVVTLEAAQLVMWDQLHCIEALFAKGSITASDRDIMTNIVQVQLRSVIDFHPVVLLARPNSAEVQKWVENTRRSHSSLAIAFDSSDEGHELQLNRVEKRQAKAALLINASRQGDSERCEKLITKGEVMPDFQDRDGRTALHVAASEDDVEVARVLVENGADVNIRDRWGNSPLDDATVKENEDVIEFLTQNGARAFTTLYDCSKKTTEFIDACREGNLEEVVRLLHETLITPDSADHDRRTGLHYAAAGGHMQIVALLLSRGAFINSKDHFGHTPLDDARLERQSDVVTFLLDAGGKTGKDEADKKAELVGKMILAAKNGNLEKVEALLETGAVAADCKDYDDRTPLHLAAYFGRVAVCKCLISHGADVNSQDHFGNTPLDEAVKSGASNANKVVTLLEKYGAKSGAHLTSSESATDASSAEGSSSTEQATTESSS